MSRRSRQSVPVTKRVCLSALLCVALAGPALAHDLQHAVGEGSAVSVRFFYGEDDVFSFEAYEVYRAGEEIPVQVGRTDARGRVVFLADGAGDWRVKVFSEDGHGADISLTTGEAGVVEDLGGPALGRSLRMLVGVSVIFGLFGLLSLFVRRRGAT